MHAIRLGSFHSRDPGGSTFWTTANERRVCVRRGAVTLEGGTEDRRKPDIRAVPCRSASIVP